MRSEPSLPAASRAAERGSAYLFALLALLVLTVIGLSLVVVTQTEVQIGGAEKSANRVLFGADAGLRIQFGMARNALAKDTVTLDTGAADGSPLLERVDMSPFSVLYSGPCALCSLNLGEERYWAVNYVVNAESRRLRNDLPEDEACLEPPQAQKLLSSMYFIQPEKLGLGKEFLLTEDVREYDSTISASDACANGLEIVKY